jgi:hypothetical protein
MWANNPVASRSIACVTTGVYGFKASAMPTCHAVTEKNKTWQTMAANSNVAT